MNRLFSHIYNRNKVLLIVLIILSTGLNVFAQKSGDKDCGETLIQARRYYELGLIEKVPGVLGKCLDNGFNKTQQSEAYELLVLTYQYDNKPNEAEDTYLDLLKHDPEYSINEANTPYELLRLYKRYHAPPIYSFGFIGGINSTFGQRIQSFSLSNSNPELETELSNYENDGLGIQFGVTIKRYISKSLELNLDLMYQNMRFKTSVSQLKFANVNYSEDQRHLKFPLSLTYDISKGKLNPYIRLGFGMTYLLSSEASVIRSYKESAFVELPNVTGPTINMSGQRNDINFFSVAGGGLKYKIPRGEIILDFRHNWYFLQQNRPSKRYENNVLVYEYHYLEDDFKLGNLTISLGYTYSIHKIKLVDRKKKVTNKD